MSMLAKAVSLAIAFLLVGIAAAQPKNRELFIPVAHMGPVSAAAFSRDGKLIATGSDDGMVTLWNSDTGEPLRNFFGHCKSVTCVAFSDDGKRLISGSNDGRISINDVATGAVTSEIRADAKGVWEMTVGGGGKFIFTADESSVVQWDVDSGKKVRSFTLPKVFEADELLLAATTDGKHLFRAASRPRNAKEASVAVWSVADGKVLRDVEVKHGVESGAGAQFLGDGKRIRFIADGWILDLDVTTEKPPVEVGEKIGNLHPFMRRIAIDPAGSYVFACDGYGSAKFVHTANGQVVALPDLVGRVAGAAAFSSDGLRALVTTFKPKEGAIHEFNSTEVSVRDPATGANLRRFASGATAPWGPVRDGDRLRVAFVERSVEWELAGTKGPVVGRAQAYQSRSAETPDRKCGISTSASREAPDAAIHEGYKPLHTLKLADDLIWSVGISDDGKRALTGTEGGSLIIWDAATGKQVHSIRAHRGPIEGVAFSADGRRVFSTSYDGTTAIWTADTGAEICRLVSFDRGKEWLVIAPDGRFDGTPAAQKLVKFRTDGKFALEPLEKYAKELHRPGLLRELWNK
jgi:WD40 repeat protein